MGVAEEAIHDARRLTTGSDEQVAEGPEVGGVLTVTTEVPEEVDEGGRRGCATA